MGNVTGSDCCCCWKGHLLCHCCDTVLCHGSLTWMLSEKTAHSIVSENKNLRELEEHPGPHPEVVVCPVLSQGCFSFLVFH